MRRTAATRIDCSTTTRKRRRRLLHVIIIIYYRRRCRYEHRVRQFGFRTGRAVAATSFHTSGTVCRSETRRGRAL